MLNNEEEMRLEDILPALAFYDSVAVFTSEHVYNTYFQALAVVQPYLDG
jgi:hypothetical protein